jgi:hypothetical protein
VTTLGMLRFVWNSNPRLLMRLSKNLEETCRSAFVAALVAEGIGPRLRGGPVPLETLHDQLGLEDARDELGAWLDVGVSLGELAKDAQGYRLTGLLSRKHLRCRSSAGRTQRVPGRLGPGRCPVRRTRAHAACCDDDGLRRHRRLSRSMSRATPMR